MKKEKNTKTTEKRSVEDFEHRMTVQLEEQHYIDYAMAHSQDQIKDGRKRAVLWAVLFAILGVIALFRGASTQGRWSDVYLTAGILMIVFQVFNLIYHFVMYPIALKNSVLKELKKDPSLTEPMVYAFEPDKLVCFLNGKHRSTVLTEDISGVENTEKTVIIEVKNGRRIIIPRQTLEQADEVIRSQVQSFAK